jgi:hypothetical protein
MDGKPKAKLYKNSSTYLFIEVVNGLTHLKYIKMVNFKFEFKPLHINIFRYLIIILGLFTFT